MTDLYNISFMDNSTGFSDLIIGIGASIGQPFLIGDVILAAFFIIILVLAYRNGFLEVLVVDSFLTVIVAMLFYSAGIVQSLAITIPAVILFISVIVYWFS